MKRILILGGSTLQLPAIKAAKNMGWQVIVADGKKDIPGFDLADRFLHIDLKDRRAMEIAAGEILENVGLDGVFTAGTDFSTTVAWVSEKLGLPGIPYAAALNATDKGRMRSCFSGAGLPSPDFFVINSLEPLGYPPFGFPVVVKPVDNMGARGIRRVDTPEELRIAAENALSLSRSGQVIIEQFIPGPEFSIDALVFEEEIYICGIADRHIVFPPYFIEIGHTIPSQAPVSEQQGIIETFKKGVKVLGIHHGAAKGDIKLSPQGPIIGEIAARLSGGYMSGWTYPYASGVDVTAAALKIAVGNPPGDLREKEQYVCAERAFISIPGKVKKILVPEMTDSGILEAFFRVERGSEVTFPRNNVEKCGNIITRDKDRGGAVHLAEETAGKVLLILDPARTDTGDFLFGDYEKWVPPAYNVEEQTLLLLGSMPLIEGQGNMVRGILPFPGQAPEHLRDWVGRSWVEALDEILSFTGLSIGSACDTGITLGSFFWKAFIRGGIQGGLWVIDRARSALSDGWEAEDITAPWFT